MIFKARVLTSLKYLFPKWQANLFCLTINGEVQENLRWGKKFEVDHHFPYLIGRTQGDPLSASYLGTSN